MKKLIISIMALIMIACGSNSDNSDNTTNEEVKSSCISDLIEGNEIEKMISQQQLADIVGVTLEDVEFIDEKSSSAKYSLVGINWAPETPRTWTMKMEIPAAGNREATLIENKTEVVNKVFYGQVDVIENTKRGPKEYFRYTYGPKTKEEKEAIKKQIDKSQDQSEEVDEKSAESLKSMVDKQSSNEVEGIGDLAYWSATKYGNFYNEKGEVETEAKIRVLHGNTQFTVSANISDNVEEDLELAKKVAKQIVANCE